MMTTDIDGFRRAPEAPGKWRHDRSLIGTPDPLLVNHLSQEAFDAVVLDMQHGMWDMASAANGVAQVRPTGKPAIARIPVADFASASRLLDAECFRHHRADDQFHR